MSNTLGIFTTLTDPSRRGDCWIPAVQCYAELADKVVIINGGTEKFDNLPSNVQVIDSEWTEEFDWTLIGKQFTKGYDSLDTSWVLYLDIDMLIHETDFSLIRRMFEDNPNIPAMSFWKYQFILPDRYNLKSRLVLAVNKKLLGDRVKFDSGGDLCRPSIDGVEIDPSTTMEMRVPVYNYEKIKKTKEQVSDDVGRMERAYLRHFGHTQYGDGSDALTNWHEAQKGKLQKPQQKILLEEHPIYMREVIKKLKPDQFGYDGWGIEGNSYAQDSSR